MSFRLTVARTQIVHALRRGVVATVNNQTVSPHARFLNTTQQLRDEQQVATKKNIAPKKILVDYKKVRQDHERELYELKESLTLANQRTEDGNLKLIDISMVMELYYKLRNTGALQRSDVSHIVQAIHNSGRMSVRTLGRMISKQRKSVILRQQEQLGDYLDAIARDLLSGTVKCAVFGIMQLFTAYATIGQAHKGMDMYQRFMESANDDLIRNTLNFKVTGAVLHLMITAGASLEKIQTVYMAERERGDGSINSDHNMVRAYILHNDLPSALKLYSNMLKVYEMTLENESYFSRVHDSFIGDSVDVEIAKTYLDQVAEGQTPYKVIVHPSSVNRLMTRCWEQNHDFDEVLDVWSKFLSNSQNFTEGNSNIVNYTLFQHFFDQNPEFTEQAHDSLKRIISIYNDKMGKVRVLFLNSLLSVASKHWNDKGVILEIIDGYDLYRIPKKMDTLRIILNSFQGLDVEPSLVQNYWEERLSQVDTAPLQKYDFWALGKACSSFSRGELFVEEWKKYLESVDLSASMQQNILGYFAVPRNNCYEVANALKAAGYAF